MASSHFFPLPEKPMSYMYTMIMLWQNELNDQGVQTKIDLARIEYSRDARMQLHLDRKQAALDEARQRNLGRIAEIARLN